MTGLTVEENQSNLLQESQQYYPRVFVPGSNYCLYLIYQSDRSKQSQEVDGSEARQKKKKKKARRRRTIWRL